MVPGVQPMNERRLRSLGCVRRCIGMCIGTSLVTIQRPRMQLMVVTVQW